jgi:anti-sigma B factor antagonist
METIVERIGETLEIKVVGRLDTMTSNQLEIVLRQVDDGVHVLIFDFSELEYLTSVGIRILISAHKMMSRQGKLILRSLNSEVSEVLDITGVLEMFEVE